MKFSNLPLRIQADILAIHYKSEYFIIAVQLALVASILLRFYVFPAQILPFRPVISEPIILLIFTLFILVRLYLNYKRKLTTPFISTHFFIRANCMHSYIFHFTVFKFSFLN